MQLIVVPALITLGVTLLRLVGELQHWSPTLFNREAGGGGALIGIGWLVPVFGIYFALKLQKNGQGPERVGRAIGLTVLAFAINTAATFGLFALKPSFLVLLSGFGVLSVISIVLAYGAWPALARVLLAYAFAARIPVVAVMLVAIFGDWGTHYDVAPPEAPQIAAMAPLLKWFWIGLVPQFTVWIYVTVVGGVLFGSIAAAISRRRPATA